MLRRIWDSFLFVCFVIFMLLLSPAILLGLGVILLFWLPVGLAQNCKWKSQLKSQGRMMSKREFDSQSRLGTLIVNQPAPGWGTLECWWTPDIIPEIAPAPEPSWDARLETPCQPQFGLTPHPFDEWVWMSYVSPQTGTAMLLATHRGDVIARKLQEKNPELRSVNSWTAMAERKESRAAIQTARAHP